MRTIFHQNIKDASEKDTETPVSHARKKTHRFTLNARKRAELDTGRFRGVIKTNPWKTEQREPRKTCFVGLSLLTNERKRGGRISLGSHSAHKHRSIRTKKGNV